MRSMETIRFNVSGEAEMKYRVLLDVHYVDLIVEADSEQEAVDKVSEHYRGVRPFGGRPRSIMIRVRQPWKHQLQIQEDVK